MLFGKSAVLSAHEQEPNEILTLEVRDADPFRLEALDTYSNILYVKENAAALSNLARQVRERRSTSETQEKCGNEGGVCVPYVRVLEVGRRHCTSREGEPSHRFPRSAVALAKPP